MSVIDQQVSRPVAETAGPRRQQQTRFRDPRAGTGIRRSIAQGAAAELALLTRAVKDAALLAMADALLDRRAEILAANELDVQAAVAAGTAESLVDRLRLNASRVDAMAPGCANWPACRTRSAPWCAVRCCPTGCT